jgi:hypothetical protein
MEELVEGISNDILRICLRMDDILHEIAQRPDHLVICQPESVLIAFPEGKHNSLFVVVEGSFW